MIWEIIKVLLFPKFRTSRSDLLEPTHFADMRATMSEHKEKQIYNISSCSSVGLILTASEHKYKASGRHDTIDFDPGFMN